MSKEIKQELLMHIYGQAQWHDSAYLVANTEALEQLRSAIDDALMVGSGFVNAFVGDGEGFHLLIARVDDDSTFGNLAVPYADEIAAENRDNATDPWKLMRIHEAGQDADAALGKEITEEIPTIPFTESI